MNYNIKVEPAVKQMTRLKFQTVLLPSCSMENSRASCFSRMSPVYTALARIDIGNLIMPVAREVMCTVDSKAHSLRLVN